MIAGAFLLVLSDASIKLYASGLPTTQIIGVRASATVLVCLMVMAKTGWAFPRLWGRDLLIRTGFTIANVFAFVAAVIALPFSLAVFVDMTNILFVAMLAPWVLAERLSMLKVVSILTGMAGAGVLLCVQVQGTGWLIVLPVLSALAGAGRELWTRKLGPDFSASSLTLYAAVGMIVVALVFGVKEWVFDQPWALGATLIAGCLQGAAMVLMTYALQNGEVSLVAPFRLTTLVWAALIAWVVFAEALTVMDFLGITLIAVALLLLSKGAGPSTPNQPV
jgi:S-adenosylmethionine uptake transporter